MADQLGRALFLIVLIIIWPVAEGTDGPLREVPASEILTKIENGLPVEYDHVIVVGNLSLSDLEDLPTRHMEEYFLAPEDVKIIVSPIRINDSIINGIVSFSNTIMENIIDFRGSTFNSSAGFSHSIFKRDADFWDSTFNSDANFIDSTFNRDADFGSTTFNRDAHFSFSTFNRDTDFGSTTFNRDNDFIGSTFRSSAKFWHSTFNRSAKFFHSTFNSSDFSSTQFNKVAYFDYTQFNGFTSFNSSRFKEDALFEDASFKDKLSLIKTKYDKLYIRWHNIMKGLVYDDAAYLSLLKNFKDLGYLEDYDCCYFEYRREHRGQDWSGINDWEEAIRKAIDYPLEWFYGYGTRPLNAFFISLGIVVVFGIFWRTIGLGGPEDVTKATLQPDQEWVYKDITDIFGFSATVFLSGTKFFIDPPAIPKINGRSRSLIKKAFTLERLLGALFSILFFIAISGTIVRSA